MEKARRGMIGIYQWRNKETGECFIGYSASMNNAFVNDAMALLKGEHRNAEFQRIWHKDGAESFVFTFLEISEDKYDLAQKEIVWLDKTGGKDIYGRSRAQLLSLISPCTHISILRSTKKEIQSLKIGTFISAVRKLVAFYKSHSSSL